MQARGALLAVCLILVWLVGGCEQPPRVISSLDDAHDATIGVMVGTTGEQLARARFPDAEIKSFDDAMDAVAALQSGQLEAVIIGSPTVLNIVRHNPALDYLAAIVEDETLNVVVELNNDELLEKINEILDLLDEEGILAEIGQRWMKQDLSPYQEVELNMPSEGEPLRVGVSATREPLCFVDENGRITGSDAELARRIALHLNRPIEFVDLRFAALIPALQSGRVDMVVSMTATEERRKSASFSRPYLYIGQVMMIRKDPAALESNGIGGPAASVNWIKEGLYRNLILENRYRLVLDGLKTTITISLLAAVFGSLLGGLICALRMSSSRILNLLAKAFISLLRGIPVLVLLMIIFYVILASTGISPILIAVFAFGLNFAAYVSEIFRTGIEHIDRGQTEAGIAMGFTPARTFLYIVMPQAIRRILPVYKGEFISLVKMTSIVGYIAVQDLTKAGDIIRSRTFDPFFSLIMVAAVYFLMTWLLVSILELVEVKTDPKKTRKKQVNRNDSSRASVQEI